MTDDAELLRRYAEERQEDAFAELVRRHLGLVHAVALRQVGGDAHLAQDVAQRVFSDLARKAGVLCRHPVLTGWLYRSAQFTAGKAMRTERRRRWREQEAHTMHELTGGSEAEIDPEKLRPVLDTAMGELSDRDRDAVMLRFFEGQAFAQIGAKLRLTEDASRMRVERALGRLRAALAQRGVISTEAALGVALASQAAQAAPAGLASVITGSALAGVGASGSVAALLAFMSTTKSTVGLAAAVIALGFGVKYVGGISATARASLAEERKTIYQLALRVDRAAADARAMRLPTAVTAAATGTPPAGQNSAVEDEGRGPFGPNPPGSRARGRA
jgi:RNA polymerase sigma factor (sigma-70 family)